MLGPLCPARQRPRHRVHGSGISGVCAGRSGELGQRAAGVPCPQRTEPGL